MVAPHDRLLHDLVLRSMPTLVDLAEERGGFVPRHVVRYLDRFGHCGEPEQGFALLRCSCGATKVVPFRCHGRALCPTCGGRALRGGRREASGRHFASDDGLRAKAPRPKRLSFLVGRIHRDRPK